MKIKDLLEKLLHIDPEVNIDGVVINDDGTINVLKKDLPQKWINFKDLSERHANLEKIKKDQEEHKNKWDKWEKQKIKKNIVDLNFKKSFAENCAKDERERLEREEKRGFISLKELKDGTMIIIDTRRQP